MFGKLVYLVYDESNFVLSSNSCDSGSKSYSKKSSAWEAPNRILLLFGVIF